MPDKRTSRYPGIYPSGKANWQYKLRLPPDPDTGRRPIETRGGYPTDYAAHLARSARQTELGLGVNTAPSELTVTQAITQFLAGRQLRPNSRRIYAYHLTANITPHIGHIRIRDLTPAQVRAWQVKMLRSRASSSVSKCRWMLSATLTQAHRDGMLARNVVSFTDGVDVESEEATVWTMPQAKAFLAVSDRDEYAALWRLALMSMLRPSELTALRWKDVDLDAGIVRVEMTATLDEDNHWTTGPAKTKASIAPVGIPDVAVTQLRHLRDVQRMSHRHRPDGWRHDLVFPNRNGEPLRWVSISRRLRRLCRQASTPDLHVPDLSPHELRHTGSDLLVKAGADPATLARALRHASPTTSLRVYTHAKLADQQAAIARLETVLDATPQADESQTENTP